MAIVWLLDSTNSPECQKILREKRHFAEHVNSVEEAIRQSGGFWSGALLPSPSWNGESVCLSYEDELRAEVSKEEPDVQGVIQLLTYWQDSVQREFQYRIGSIHQHIKFCQHQLNFFHGFPYEPMPQYNLLPTL